MPRKPKKSKPETFPDRLRRLRLATGLSQTALGELVDLHYTHIGRYERGISQPTADALLRLGKALGVSGGYLLDGGTPSGQAAEAADVRDPELLALFREVEGLPKDDRNVIKTLIDAFITKRRVQALAGR